VGLERGPLSLVSTTEELLDRKVAATFEEQFMGFPLRFPPLCHVQFRYRHRRTRCKKIELERGEENIEGSP
jgi:hypothetical protein